MFGRRRRGVNGQFFAGYDWQFRAMGQTFILGRLGDFNCQRHRRRPNRSNAVGYAFGQPTSCDFWTADKQVQNRTNQPPPTLAGGTLRIIPLEKPAILTQNRRGQRLFKVGVRDVG